MLPTKFPREGGGNTWVGVQGGGDMVLQWFLKGLKYSIMYFWNKYWKKPLKMWGKNKIVGSLARAPPPPQPDRSETCAQKEGGVQKRIKKKEKYHLPPNDPLASGNSRPSLN